MNNFPNISVPETEKNEGWQKSYIDATIQFHETGAPQREAWMDRIYDSFNGLSKSIAKSYLTERYGKKSKIPFIRYNYGRSKIKLLFGEMLDLKFDSTVEVTNPEARAEKLKNAEVMMGAMAAKPQLEAVKEATGMKILNGAEIPEQDDPQAHEKITPKLAVEVFMQAIIDDKIETDKLVRKAYEFFTDLAIVSECHCFIDRDQYGNDVVEFIPAKNAIYMESPADPFCDKSPFHGYKKYMYMHQIMQKWPDLTKTEIDEIQSNTHDKNNNDITKNIGGETAYPVWYVEWNSPKAHYYKTSKKQGSDVPYITKLSPEFYEQKKNRKSVDRQVKKGQATMETVYSDKIFKGYRIGQTVYKDLGRKEDMIQKRDDGKYKCHSDFTHLLFGTVNGSRISIQELIYHLDEIYDVIMWQITREIKKMKGTVLKYDEAASPKIDDMKTVMFNMQEEGLLKVNSIEEGNYYGRDVIDATKIVEALDLGLGQSMEQLINLKNTIEYTIDRITGINIEREGRGMASATATTNQANIEASRNITKDMYFFLNEFMEILIMKLAEKVKLNKAYLKKKSTAIKFGDRMINFAPLINDIEFYEFGTKLTDGRLVHEVKEKVRHLFNQEINAGQLRTRDVIEFETARTITQGLQVLDNAWEAIKNIDRENMESKERIAAQQQETQLKIATDDREDRQDHESEENEKDRDVDVYKADLKSKDTNAKIKADLEVKKEAEKQKKEKEKQQNNTKTKK